MSTNHKFETLQLYAVQEIDPTTGSEHIDDIKSDFEQAFAKINSIGSLVQ